MRPGPGQTGLAPLLRNRPVPRPVLRAVPLAQASAPLHLKEYLKPCRGPAAPLPGRAHRKPDPTHWPTPLLLPSCPPPHPGCSRPTKLGHPQPSCFAQLSSDTISDPGLSGLGLSPVNWETGS